jgi:ketosteroid isomerase-like protein
VTRLKPIPATRSVFAAAALLVAVGATDVFAQQLPPKKPQTTPEKVIAEHVAALNACDWNRMMAQYDDNIAFLSKDGNIVKGRAAIGKMFTGALQPPAKGGQCGMKLIPEQTIVVGDTVNVIWRAEAPFFAQPYKGSEAFETKNGLLVLQVTTWDPSAIKMKK